MGLFNRKKKKVPEEPKEIEIIPPPHEHTWKDMPWYMDTHYNGNYRTAGYTIIEPYICITCGERKNVVLEEIDWSGIDVDEREKEFQAVRNRYKRFLRPQAIVEDMINNITLVKDPQRLAMLEKMLGSPHSNVGSSAEKVNEEEKKKESDFRIILPPRSNK